MISNSLVCPRCGEENFEEAIMCWGCTGPLPGKNGEGERARVAHEARQRELKRSEKAKAVASCALLLGGLGALVASGYFSSGRFALLSVSIACIGAFITWLKMDRRPSAASVVVMQEDPIENTLNSVLAYAARSGATQIRLRAGVGVQVHYCVDDEWQEQGRVPDHAWVALRSRLIEKTAFWQESLRFSVMGRAFEAQPEFQRDSQYPLEIVTLRLRQAV